MNSINNSDKEKLDLLNKSILDLNNLIDQLDEVKKLNNAIKEKMALENKIKVLSTYEIDAISNIISKLMSKYEGIEYQFEKSLFSNNVYISPNYKQEFPYIHPTYSIEIIQPSRDKKIISCLEKKEVIDKCLLLPSFYTNNIQKEKELYYIQKFIDFLYENRSNNLIYDINDNYLENILNNFIEKTTEDQLIRKQQINSKVFENEQYKKRKAFKQSCLIDRDLIYNSIAYITNHYEEEIKANQLKEEEKEYSSNWITLHGVHKLILENNESKFIYKSIIDTDGCYPDEEYCGLYVNLDKKSNVYFFDLKEKLSSIISNSIYLKAFIEMIEQHYYENINITNNDVKRFLTILSNKRKLETENKNSNFKQKVLKISQKIDKF